jgi:hypothetical protein
MVDCLSNRSREETRKGNAMKSFPAALVIIGVAAAFGTMVHFHRQKAPPVQAAQALSESKAVPKEELPPIVSGNTTRPEETPTLIPAATPPFGDSKPAAPSVAHSPAGDTLVSTQTSFSARQALLKQLKSLGTLDATIAELKLRTAESPDDARIPTALGEALMNKFPFKDYNEMAMMGLQIDQSFNAALKLDPSDWEAQFFKASALAVWPAEMKTGPEVIQRLSKLIDQQDTMSPQPQFAQTYVLLGEQYQKAGQPEYAVATWTLGLSKFRNDKSLQQHLAAR